MRSGVVGVRSGVVGEVSWGAAQVWDLKVGVGKGVGKGRKQRLAPDKLFRFDRRREGRSSDRGTDLWM